jgi:hypothetical protein
MLFHRRTVLDFEPATDIIPEITPNQVPDCVDWIYRRRITNQASYGAILVRAGGIKLAKEAVVLLGQRLKKQTPIMHCQEFRYISRTAGAGYLHRDKGQINDMTAHVTTVGSAQAIIVPATTQAPQHGFTGASVPELFENGTV